MRWIKIAGFAIVAALIIIQFIQPASNLGRQALPTDLTKTIQVPKNVETILKRACYDCHSNNTTYLWYDNIQPARWLVEYHIRHGKAALNFSEFGTYSARKQMNKLKAISNSMKEESMPIPSYTKIHATARLTKEEREQIILWADNACHKSE